MESLLRKSLWKILCLAIILVLFLSHLAEAGWSSQCWRTHNAGSIQTPDGEFRRPFGIVCTYQCFLWFQPLFPQCEFIFDLRTSRRFSTLPDCYEIHCNETFTLFNDPK